MRSLRKLWIVLPLASMAALPAFACSHASGTAAPSGSSSSVSSGSSGMPPGLVCAGSKAGVKHLFYGDLHVHTNYSFDAYFFNGLNGPAEAFAFAKGAATSLPCGESPYVPCLSVKLDAPLDFTAVTDHSELLGGFLSYCGGDAGVANAGLCTLLDGYITAAAKAVAIGVTPSGPGLAEAAVLIPSIADTTDAWGRSMGFADAANDPCSFTAFAAYEYTGVPNGASLHRNIVFNGPTLPKKPVSSLDVANEWEMWTALDGVCGHDASCDYVSIPHSSNASDGRMFQSSAALAAAVTQAQIAQRASNDVLVEVIQNKGESECGLGYADMLSVDEDSACTFEKLKPLCTGAPTDPSYCRQPCTSVATDGDGGAAVPQDCTAPLDMVRDVLVEGLRAQGRYQGVNPYKLGIVGATDTHNGDPGNTREDSYRGHGGILDDAPDKLLGAWECADGGATCATADRTFAPKAVRFNPGGLTGVWAEENTRASLFAALKRREVYATSGTRVALKLYAAWSGLSPSVCSDLAAGTDPVESGAVSAVPMGADLPARASGSGGPQFVVRAVSDPIIGTPLGRIEIIKGWVDAGGAGHTQVFVVAGGTTGPAPGQDCSVTKQSQPEQLCGTWTDPSFDPAQRAFYYARAFENPSCRWSTWMCVKQSIDCTKLDPTTGTFSGAAAGYEGCCAITQQGATYTGTARFETIQERAWSSPVWWSP
jgi:hypothetical protein